MHLCKITQLWRQRQTSVLLIIVELGRLPVTWRSNYTQAQLGLSNSVGSDSRGCGGNTDGCNVSEASSLCSSPLRYLPTAASSPLRRSELIGGHWKHRVTMESTAWRIGTVAKVFSNALVTIWGLHLPSVFTWWMPVKCEICGLLSFSSVGQTVQRCYRRLSGLQATFVQIWPASCRISLHWTSFFNSLPRDVWQKLLLSTDRPLFLKSSSKKAQVQPQFRAHGEGKLFQLCRLSTSLKAGGRGFFFRNPSALKFHSLLDFLLHLWELIGFYFSK